jgi:hypothetical protein
MTYLIPQNTQTPTQGDQSYWENYVLIETEAILGPANHQAIVQARLNAFKFENGTTYQISDIQTRIYVTQAPMPTQVYLTTIRFSTLGDPTSYPIPPA